MQVCYGAPAGPGARRHEKIYTPYGNVWETSAKSNYTYTVNDIPLSFVERLMDKQWLSLTGSSFDDPIKAAGAEFPVMGLAAYRDRIAALCKED